MPPRVILQDNFSSPQYAHMNTNSKFFSTEVAGNDEGFEITCFIIALGENGHKATSNVEIQYGKSLDSELYLDSISTISWLTGLQSQDP